MAQFDEAQHPRGQGGRFAAKGNGRPDTTLAAPAAPYAHLTSGVTEDLDCPDPDNFERFTQHNVTGPLADRIRKRFGAGAGERVTIRELMVNYGTEWTREIEHDFTISAGEHEVMFEPRNDTTTWQDAASPGPADSVFSRFNTWLRAGEEPGALAREWFTHAPERSCDKWEEYSVTPGTDLHHLATSRYGRRAEHVTLRRVPDSRDRDAKLADTDSHCWQLDVIAPANADGFRQILNRTVLYEYTSKTEEGIPDDVIRELTDRFMTGPSPR